MGDVSKWAARGKTIDLGGRRIFVIDTDTGVADHDPVLILHGFPTCSFDWRHVIGTIGADRRVVVFDMLGYGLSEKPNAPYSLFVQANLAVELVERLELERVALVTHDMGDSVGGELCARDLDGTLSFTIGHRVVSNGSIYIRDAKLTDGQKLLLALPDEPLPAEIASSPDAFFDTMRGIFGNDTPPSQSELTAQWELLTRDDGARLLARLIRYVDERREHEKRWTGALANHPGSLAIVWGDADPIAGFGMAERLAKANSGAPVTRLDGIGHYPMIEAPEDFAAAVVAGLDS